MTGPIIENWYKLSIEVWRISTEFWLESGWGIGVITTSPKICWNYWNRDWMLIYFRIKDFRLQYELICVFINSLVFSTCRRNKKKLKQWTISHYLIISLAGTYQVGNHFQVCNPSNIPLTTFAVESGFK